MSEIEQKVKDIIIKELKVDAAKVVGSANFSDDLGADSLDSVELIMKFEEEFDCEIPQDIAEKLTTVQSVVDHLEKKQVH
jgi:acyl carrier protein